MLSDKLVTHLIATEFKNWTDIVVGEMNNYKLFREEVANSFSKNDRSDKKKSILLNKQKEATVWSERSMSVLARIANRNYELKVSAMNVRVKMLEVDMYGKSQEIEFEPNLKVSINMNRLAKKANLKEIFRKFYSRNKLGKLELQTELLERLDNFHLDCIINKSESVRKDAKISVLWLLNKTDDGVDSWQRVAKRKEEGYQAGRY